MGDLRAELDELKRLSKLDAYRAASFPGLAAKATDAMAGGVDDSDSIEMLVGTAIASMSEGPHKAAASQLIGFGPDRWQSLKQRRARAAEATGMSPETFRRREEATVLDEVARQIAGLGGSQAEPAVHRRSIDRSRIAVVVSLLGLLLLAVLGYWVLPGLRADGDVEASGVGATPAREQPANIPVDLTGPLDVTLWCVEQFGPGASAEVTGQTARDWACRSLLSDGDAGVDFDAACAFAYGQATRAQNLTNDPYGWECRPSPDAIRPGGPCEIGVGTYDPLNSHAFDQYASPFVRAWRAAETDLCPGTIMHRWGQGVVQELGDSTPDGYEGAILAVDPDDVVVLDGSLWKAYERVIGLSPGLVGFPAGEPVEIDDGSEVLHLSAGGALVSRPPTDQYYWLPGVAFTAWLESGGRTGCLGSPVSNPYAVEVGFRQDYESAGLILDLTQGEIQVDGDCAIDFED
ncbi:MAG: hypothetical protein AAGA65_31395 [Actinomycetota bacterium]